jgi:hypothetical protein
MTNLFGDDVNEIDDEMNDVVEVYHNYHYQNNLDYQKEVVVLDKTEDHMETVDNRSHQVLRENLNLVRIDHL